MQLGIVVFLLFGPVRRYAFVLGYCVLQLFTSVLEMVISREFGHSSKRYWRVFWSDEIALDLLLFFILMLLTHRAMEGSPLRAAMQKLLGAVAAMVVALPFVLYHGPS